MPLRNRQIISTSPIDLQLINTFELLYLIIKYNKINILFVKSDSDYVTSDNIKGSL